jgi:hypothetical protein
MKQHMTSVRLQLEDGINIMPAPVPSDQGGTPSMPLPAERRKFTTDVTPSCGAVPILHTGEENTPKPKKKKIY